MFTRARLSLTAWYLLIIMLVSIFFSIAIYEILTVELERVEKVLRYRQEIHMLRPEMRSVPFELRQGFSRIIILDTQIIEETKNRLKLILLLINAGILLSAGMAGYFLAGVTLRPIRRMLDEQNRFITDASHEMRTPITSLKTEIEVDLRSKALSSDIKRILKSNLDEVNKLQELSDNLITLIQRGDNNSFNAFIEVSLDELFDDACRKVGKIAKNKKIRIDKNLRARTVVGDRQSLTEAFVIFLDNAVKYSNQNTTIKIEAEVLKKYIAILIQDEGVGIAKKDLPFIFERFYRADKSRTKAQVDGFGLGLSIARQIIEKHGGSIGVESEVGKGTTFVVKLPYKKIS